MVGGPGNPVTITLEADDLAELRASGAEGSTHDFHAEVAGSSESAQVQVFTGCWIGYERGVGSPVPCHGLAYFGNNLGRICGHFVFDAHARMGAVNDQCSNVVCSCLIRLVRLDELIVHLTLLF